MKRKKSNNSILQNCRGFSLIEVLLGISIFMIGMLGVTALNISSLKSNTFSGNLSEAALLAGTQIEELMATDYDDILDNDGDGTDQDTNDDGIDNIGGGNFGLDDIGAGADEEDLDAGKLEMYNVYWNVADNEPVSVPPPGTTRTKTIRVIVQWFVKDQSRQISMDVIRMKEE
jgi:prepilin-type N-terminal cleavage/methylation domain-containing protein